MYKRVTLSVRELVRARLLREARRSCASLLTCSRARFYRGEKFQGLCLLGCPNDNHV